MNSYWEGKVVLITGASAGFGAVLAEVFAAAGARLVLAARGKTRLDEVARRLEGRRAEVLATPTDITDQEQVVRLVAQGVERFGGLDVLVNNAGRSTRANIGDVGAAEFQELLELNFLGAVRCTQAALPSLLKSRGHVVNMGSLAAKVAARFLGGYPASKFALAAYSQQLRLELGPKGLHVLLACPGPIAHDSIDRYAGQNIPVEALRPGGGAKMSVIDPRLLAKRVLVACQKRKSELIVPRRARLLFAVAQISPRLGDWLLLKTTGAEIPARSGGE